MSRWGVVSAPAPVEGGDPAAGRLEPALQQLAACQGSWPPRRPASVPVLLDAAGSLDDGVALADDLIDRGADLLLALGAGDGVDGLLVAAALLDLEPVRAVGTAPGTDWVRQTVAVRDGLRVARPHRGNPASLLEAVAAGAVARGAGLLAQAASRRTLVLLDGSTSVAAAALCAARMAPGAHTWWLAGTAPPVPAAAEAHRELQLRPLLDLGLAGPAGGAIALSVLEQACDLVVRA
jgi:nicotinate-nucleotide--dimethylbenzimidazole phosphoribosyltransferase